LATLSILLFHKAKEESQANHVIASIRAGDVLKDGLPTLLRTGFHIVTSSSINHRTLIRAVRGCVKGSRISTRTSSRLKPQDLSLLLLIYR
jgi:uncharacterized protein (DUF934 family)